MCPIPTSPRSHGDGHEWQPVSDMSYFTCNRLNSSTFTIVEEDKWYEIPYIYVKIYPSVIVLFDTGCGGAPKNPNAGLISLRKYIETVPIQENGNQPLNAEPAKPYVIICTHCHFDHIGGIDQFPEATIWAGSHDKPFLDKENLDTTSMCKFFDVKTPIYTVTDWADDKQEVLGPDGTGLRLFVFHTPGHTPDSISVWDPTERVVFVGDTLYEDVWIVFPLEGDVEMYFASLQRLRSLVQEWNTMQGQKEVTLACGHSTTAAKAKDLIDAVETFLRRVLARQVKKTILEENFRGGKLVYFKEDENPGRISFMMPESFAPTEN